MQPIISLAAIAKIASVTLLGATAAGVGVFTWAAITTQGDEQAQPTTVPQQAQAHDTPSPVSSPLQSPPPGSRFTADQAIVYATNFSDAEDVSHVEATLMTYAEARELTKTSTIFPNEPDPDSPTWLIAFTGRFYTYLLNDLISTGSPTAPALCTTEYIYLVEDPLAPVGSATRADSCAEHDTISREVAIFNAVRFAGSALAYETPPFVSAELMAAPDALPLVDERFPLLQPAYSFPPGDQLWVVTFTGFFKPHATGLLDLSVSETPGRPTPTPTPAPTQTTTPIHVPTHFPSQIPTPAPTTTPTPTPASPNCAEIVIMIAAKGEPLLGWYFPRVDCTPPATPPRLPITTLTPTPLSTEHDSPVPTSTSSPLTYDPPLIPNPTPTPVPAPAP